MRALAIALVLAHVAIALPAAADAPTQAERDAVETSKANARQAFTDGVDQVKKFQWAEALASFERSYGLVPNAITSLNIGLCERALGRYVRARRSLERALSENQLAGGGVLSASSVADADSYLKELDDVVVRARMSVSPAGASLSVDGRPLEEVQDKSGKVLAAGLATSGRASAVPGEPFDLLLDPGNHVFVLSRKGYADAVVNRTVSPGQKSEITIELEKLPATLKVSASQPGAIVRVGTIDVGPAPVDVLRPAGEYPVRVFKDGFVPYETKLSVRAGEEAKLNAVLTEESFNVAEQWWFWTSIAAGLGTAAVVTYFAVKPEDPPPPYDGGSSGWVVQPALLRF